jgi:ribosome-binding factor A
MDRSRQHHRERLREALRTELTSIVEGELSDPRIPPLSVSEVQIAPDGKSVRAFVQLDNEDKEAHALDGLHAAKGYIRRELAERLGLQKVPEIIFEIDKSAEYGSRIDELLKRTAKKSK